MQFTLADLHHYALPSDRQVLDQIQIRAAERKAQEIEDLVRGCMARKPPEPETVTCTRPTISQAEGFSPSPVP